MRAVAQPLQAVLPQPVARTCCLGPRLVHKFRRKPVWLKKDREIESNGAKGHVE